MCHSKNLVQFTLISKSSKSQSVQTKYAANENIEMIEWMNEWVSEWIVIKWLAKRMAYCVESVKIYRTKLKGIAKCKAST